MTERRCCRCHDVIVPGEDFYSQDGEDSDEVYCIGCIDDALDFTGAISCGMFEWRGAQKEE